MKPNSSKKTTVSSQPEASVKSVELVQSPVYDIDEYLKDLEANSGSQANDFLSLLSASTDVSKGVLKSKDQAQSESDEVKGSQLKDLFQINKTKLNDALKSEPFHSDFLVSKSADFIAKYFNDEVLCSLNEKSVQSSDEFQRLYKLNYSDKRRRAEKTDQAMKQIDSLITKLQNEKLEIKPIIDTSSANGTNIDDWLDDLISE